MAIQWAFVAYSGPVGMRKEAMIDGMKDSAARARAEALFRKDDERALEAQRAVDVAQAEKTARLRALRLAKEEADRAQRKGRR